MKNNLYSLVLFLAFTINTSPKTFAQAVNVTDSLALVNLYNNTNGPNWKNHSNWLAGPVSTWYGITVTGSAVTSVALDYNLLSGKLPSSLWNLLDVTKIDLSYNALTGTVSDSISRLTKLNYLSLTGNALTGKIPASISKLIYLNQLYLGRNQLTGSVPAGIGSFIYLDALDLSYNKLSGVVPKSFGNLTNLTLLSLNNNNLSGQVLAIVSKLTKLAYLDLHSNHFTQNANTDSLQNSLPSTQVSIADNNFNFNGLEYVATKIPHAEYSPQAQITVHKRNKKLAVYAGGTLSNNTYKWFKVGTTATVTITGDSTYLPKKSGKYYVQVTNAVATLLTLASDTISYAVAAAVAEMPELSVYPNPVVSQLTLKGLVAADNNKITITDAYGMIRLSTVAKQQTEMKVYVNNLKPGNYIINVNNGTAQYSIKFMKE